MRTPGLTDAYALSGPDDIRRLYAGWAETYDTDFAAGMAYRLPAEVAAACLRAGPPVGPVLDAGAGTGLVAQALRGMGHAGAIDGVDLSPEMLERARAKTLYRALVQADLTQPLPLAGPYAAIVSSGTFTRGHVGPQALAHLLAVAAPGAVLAFSVNAAVWEASDFAGVLASLSVQGLDRVRVPIYGAKAHALDPAHASDTALIVTLRAR